MTMAQMGFFDLSDRYASLDAKRDPLLEIDAVVPWEEFRPTLERVWRKPEAARKSRAGRKPMDAVFGPLTRTSGVRGLAVQDAGLERALQPVGRPDRVSGARLAVGQDGSSGLALRAGSPTPRRSGSIARRWQRQARWRRCSSNSTAICRGRARVVSDQVEAYPACRR